jgi:hypothetical protein
MENSLTVAVPDAGPLDTTTNPPDTSTTWVGKSKPAKLAVAQDCRGVGEPDAPVVPADSTRATLCRRTPPLAAGTVTARAVPSAVNRRPWGQQLVVKKGPAMVASSGYVVRLASLL